jgi:hypothetical protein
MALGKACSGGGHGFIKWNKSTMANLVGSAPHIGEKVVKRILMFKQEEWQGEASGSRRRSGNQAQPAPRLSDRAPGQDERRKGPPIRGDVQLHPRRQLLVGALKAKFQVRKTAKLSPRAAKLSPRAAKKISPQGGKTKSAGGKKIESEGRQNSVRGWQKPKLKTGVQELGCPRIGRRAGP